MVYDTRVIYRQYIRHVPFDLVTSYLDLVANSQEVLLVKIHKIKQKIAVSRANKVNKHKEKTTLHVVPNFHGPTLNILLVMSS